MWLYRDNIFRKNEDGRNSHIGYLQFKKHFFPQLLQIQDLEDINGTPGQQWEKRFLTNGVQTDILDKNKNKNLEAEVATRLMEIDRLIKNKV